MEQFNENRQLYHESLRSLIARTQKSQFAIRKMKIIDRMVEKERDLDEKIAAMQNEIAELHLRLLQDRTKAADTEFFIESGRFEPIECANFR